MLRPLSELNRVKCDFYPGSWHRGKVIGAFETLMPPGDPDDWYFRTYVSDIRCNYHELWMAADDMEENYWLQKAFLSLLKVKPNSPMMEIVALHTEPHDDNPEPMRSYKRSPHVHVDGGAGFPISKAHWPLELGQLDSVMKGLRELMEAYRRAIHLINGDLLNRFR